MDCKGKMHNKTVIITGGGKGIGFGVATAFAKEGANLVLTGRTPSTLEKAKDSLEKDYGIKVPVSYTHLRLPFLLPGSGVNSSLPPGIG